MPSNSVTKEFMTHTPRQIASQLAQLNQRRKSKRKVQSMTTAALIRVTPMPIVTTLRLRRKRGRSKRKRLRSRPRRKKLRLNKQRYRMMFHSLLMAYWWPLKPIGPLTAQMFLSRPKSLNSNSHRALIYSAYLVLRNNSNSSHKMLSTLWISSSSNSLHSNRTYSEEWI